VLVDSPGICRKYKAWRRKFGPGTKENKRKKGGIPNIFGQEVPLAIIILEQSHVTALSS
jgi:hypothetical protein